MLRQELRRAQRRAGRGGTGCWRGRTFRSLFGMQQAVAGLGLKDGALLFGGVDKVFLSRPTLGEDYPAPQWVTLWAYEVVAR